MHRYKTAGIGSGLFTAFRLGMGGLGAYSAGKGAYDAVTKSNSPWEAARGLVGAGITGLGSYYMLRNQGWSASGGLLSNKLLKHRNKLPKFIRKAHNSVLPENKIVGDPGNWGHKFLGIGVGMLGQTVDDKVKDFIVGDPSYKRKERMAQYQNYVKQQQKLESLRKRRAMTSQPIGSNQAGKTVSKPIVS